jgi:hypothetical protein
VTFVTPCPHVALHLRRVFFHVVFSSIAIRGSCVLFCAVYDNTRNRVSRCPECEHSFYFSGVLIINKRGSYVLYCCAAVFLSTVCTGIEFMCVILLPVSVCRPPLLLIGYTVLPVCIQPLSSCSFSLCFLQPMLTLYYVLFLQYSLTSIMYSTP